MALEYITTRDLENKSGAVTGKVRILKKQEDSFASVEFKCPECGTVEKKNYEWSEPFTSGTGKKQVFNLACKCGAKIKLLKLKKEIMKKK
jgi:hypothetical protein